MIEYPNCDKNNCWFKYDSDSVNKYYESNTYIVNSSIDRKEYDLSDYTCPVEITLCNVCDLGPDYTCLICDREMLDDWIKDSDDNHICRFCIDDLFKYDNFEEEYEDLNKLIYETDLKLDEFLEENKDNQRLMNLLDDLVKQKIEEKKKENKKKEDEEKVKKKLRIENLEKLLPSFDQDELNIIDKLIIKNRKDIDLSSGLFSFIRSILN